MALDRIPAVRIAPSVHNRAGTDTASGSPLQVAPYATETLPQVATAGLPLPQAGLSTLGNALTAESAVDAPAAMRPDQVFFSRQVVWQSQDTTSLATSWQVMVRTYGEQRAALDDQARGQHVPAGRFMADHTPLALRDSPQPTPMPEAEPWRFWVYPWYGQRLMLRVLATDSERGAEPRQRSGKIALRLEMLLPGTGRVIIQMELAGTGIVLALAAPQASSMQHLREMLPQLATAIARSGLTIVRYRLVSWLSLAGAHSNFPTQAQAATLPLSVFKAMAEVADLLSQSQALPEKSRRTV